MDSYKTLIQLKREREAQRSAKYRLDSRERLKTIASKKIRTTMIGALDTIERHFGVFWEAEKDGTLSDEAKHVKQIYERIREEILDNGNNQIRNMMTEIDQYDVEWLRYTLNLPVINKQNSGEIRNDSEQG